MKKVITPNPIQPSLQKGHGLIFFFIFLVFLDMAIKSYVFTHIPMMSWKDPYYPYGGVGIFRDLFGCTLSINHIANRGAAWGLFSSYSDFLFYMRLMIILVLVAYLYFLKDKSKKFAFLLVLAGAIGNVLDYFIYGHVIDYFYLQMGEYGFPLFNLADSLICFGIFLLFILSFGKKKEIHAH